MDGLDWTGSTGRGAAFAVLQVVLEEYVLYRFESLLNRTRQLLPIGNPKR